MKYTPPRKSLRTQIWEMEPKTVVTFSGAKPASIKAIASMVARGNNRKYRTSKIDGGVTVWRDK